MNVLITFLRMSLLSIQRIYNAQPLLGLLNLHPSRSNKLLLRLAPKREFVNQMTKVVLLSSLEVRNEIVHVHGVRLEGSSGGEMEVSNDLVDANFTGDVTSFARLLFDLVGPSFTHALFDRNKVTLDTWSLIMNAYLPARQNLDSRNSNLFSRTPLELHHKNYNILDSVHLVVVYLRNMFHLIVSLVSSYSIFFQHKENTNTQYPSAFCVAILSKSPFSSFPFGASTKSPSFVSRVFAMSWLTSVARQIYKIRSPCLAILR